MKRPDFQSFPEPQSPTGASPAANSAPGDRNRAAGTAKNTIEVSLPQPREGEVTFAFKVPAWETLAASANRLLKFELPIARDVQVYERLIKAHLVSSGLSKKTLESLPFPFLETIYKRLWEAFFENRRHPLDSWITLYLLIEEMSEFRPDRMVEADIRQLGLHEANVMHSYYYQGPLEREHLATFLAGQHYETGYLAESARESTINRTGEAGAAPGSPELAYLLCRRLTSPLPWMALLDALEARDLERFPRLCRLKNIAGLLEGQDGTDQPLSETGIQSAITLCKQVMEGEDMAEIAMLVELPEPVRMVVIVEGETEKQLLPIFAKTLGYDFNALGIHLTPAGGKNHVGAIYHESARLLNVPVCILLDRDAEEVARDLRGDLRPKDLIFEIAQGEFEDLYDPDLMIRTINRHYQPYPEMTRTRLKELAKAQNAGGNVQALKAVWTSYNLGSFDKIEFAARYAEAFQAGKPPVPPAVSHLVETLMRVRAGKL